MGQSADIELIQNQLHEKEQLVTALTERLEQAAEQLDRLRRTGVDKGRRPPGGGGLPTELVDEHKSTLEDLKRVIARWEDIQAEATLGRIETQIVELRDLVVTGGIGTGGIGSSGASHAGHSAAHSATHSSPSQSAPAPVKPKPAEIVAHQAGGKGGGNAWWEAQKAAMLGEPVSAAVQAQLEQQAAAVNVAEPAEAADGNSPGEPSGSSSLADFNVPDLPPPVNGDEISLDEALAAIRLRDDVIRQLREPILLWKTAGMLPAGVHSLSELPEALTKCVADLEAQWQAKFRQVELDLSLERARLAREQSAVRQQQEALQKQSRSGGGAKTDPKAGDGDDDSSSKRRWFKFMGSAAEGGQPTGADQKK